MSARAAPRHGFQGPRALIDLEALVGNCRLVSRLAPAARILAVIKADAYGHGAAQAARTLHGVADRFGVARLDEALALRRQGVRDRLVLLQGCLAPGELDEAVARDFEVVVHREDQLAEVTDGRRTGAVRVWLKLDTGMHRLGLDPAGFRAARERLLAAPGVSEIVAMSHLACADELDNDFTRRQLAAFEAATRGLAEPRSLANSAAVLAWPDTHLDWVRPGIMLYGASPLDRPASAAEPLRPVMRFVSEVIAVRELEPGESIGYGRRFICDRPTRVGTVVAGYGDGYPRHAPDGTPVLVDGRRTRLIGRVSMDSLTVDLTDLPAAGVGARVELWGPELPVGEVATACGTIAYELLSRVAPRVPRDYRNAAEDSSRGSR